MKRKLKGAFIFNQTNSGNLLGEFINNEKSVVITESADIDSESLNSRPFIGSYLSTWREDELYIYKLVIKSDSNSPLFHLTWSINSDQKEIFQGKGFLSNNALVGYYWSI